jgi:hypothetical protein
MPVDSKLDPFKPKAPAIPGVPAASEKQEKPEQEQAAPTAQVSSGARRPAAQDSKAKLIGIAVGIGVVLLAGVVLLNSNHNSSRPNLRGSSDATATDLPAAPAKTERSEKLLVGPGPVATTEELAKPWSSREFLFRGPFNADPVPAMVVRLPGGELWGFSLREPFGECQLQYVTDLQALETGYGFHAEHPMVVNPCTHAVYDLMRYGGGAPNGGLVRGDIVQGAGVRPPMAIEMSTKGKEIIAVRSE